MRISDWSSDVCSSDLSLAAELRALSPCSLRYYDRQAQADCPRRHRRRRADGSKAGFTRRRKGAVRIQGERVSFAAFTGAAQSDGRRVEPGSCHPARGARARCLANRPGHAMSRTLAGMNVLVVDDNKFIVGLLQRYLEKFGVTAPLHAHAGMSALDQVDSAPVDLVLCDLSLPELGRASGR